MKKIETVIQPHLWPDARAAFETLGVSATLREVQTFGRTPPRREVYRGSPYVVELASELELATVVGDEQAESVILALEELGGTAEILVSSVEGTVRMHPASGAVRAAKAVAVEPTAPLSIRLASAHA
ncbi:MAG: P-II family nitrogen regulator [Polyangiaceae bacterium]